MDNNWKLKLHAPLNSNHYGIYFINTTERDLIVLISDNHIEIYELSSFQIN